MVGCCHGAGRLGQAQSSFERALLANPNFAEAANNLAWLISENGLNDVRALELAQQASQLKPDDPHIADTYGWILYKSGDFPGAVKQLKLASAKLEGEAGVSYHYGMASLKAGDSAAARQALTRALQSPTNYPWKEDARKALAGIR